MTPPRRTALSQAEQTEIVRRIVELVGRAGSVRGLAAKAGFSESVIRKWREGRTIPSYGNLVKLARAMGVSVGWLTAGEGDAGDEGVDYGAAPRHPHWRRLDDGTRQRCEASFEDALTRLVPGLDRPILWDLDAVTSEPPGRPGDLGIIDTRVTTPVAAGYYLLQDERGPWLGRIERGPGGWLLALPGPRTRWLPLADPAPRILGRLRGVLSR